jgi:hypothetical protein
MCLLDKTSINDFNIVDTSLEICCNKTKDCSYVEYYVHTSV